MTTVTTPLGEIRQHDDGTRSLVFRRGYPDPVEDVWSALTESDRLARWLGSYEGDAVPGGSVQLTMTAPEDAGAEPASVLISECRPPRRLVVDISEAGGRLWHIAVTLAVEDGATTLLFEQVLPPDLDPADVGWAGTGTSIGWRHRSRRLRCPPGRSTFPRL